MIQVKFTYTFFQWIFIFLPLTLLAQETDPNKNMIINTPDLEVVSMTAPFYPRKAMLEGIEGHVVLQFDTDENGRVQKVKIVESVPGRVFDIAALKAVYQWVFKPKNAKNLVYTMKYKLEK